MKKKRKQLKKLNIPIETLVSEFNRLEDLEDNTEMLKSELKKKDKIIDKMAELIEECRSNDCIESEEIDISEIAGEKNIIDYFTNLVQKGD